MTWDRRHFLRVGALALAGRATASAPATATEKPSDLTFVVVNDIHYRDQRCGAWLGKVTASLLALHPRPAFIMLAGDLSDLGAPEQLGPVQEIFRALPIPIRTVIGNHDYTAAGSRAAYEKTFGPTLNYRFDAGECQFLALDTTQGRAVYRTRIPAETLTWLDGELPRLSLKRPLVVLTHFPLGWNWLRPLNAHEVIDRLQPYGLQAVFSGHWHGATEHVEGSAHLSTGRCCSWWRNNHDGSKEKGYALCHLRSGVVSHEFVAVS